MICKNCGTSYDHDGDHRPPGDCLRPLMEQNQELREENAAVEVFAGRLSDLEWLRQALDQPTTDRPYVLRHPIDSQRWGCNWQDRRLDGIWSMWLTVEGRWKPASELRTDADFRELTAFRDLNELMSAARKAGDG